MTPNPARPTRLFQLLVVLAGVGLFLSLHLTLLHHRVHTDPTYHALCDVGGSLRCGSVALSPYSVFLGAPIAAWGIAFYLTLLLLAAWGSLGRHPRADGPLGVLLGLTCLASLASLTLTYVSLFRLQSICLYCNALHLTNAATLFTTVILLERSSLSPVRALRADLQVARQLPLSTRCAAIFYLCVFFSLPSLVPNYWSDPPSTATQVETGFTPEGEPWIGAKDPSRTIVEFSDYECPHCRLAHWKIRRLLQQYPDQVRIVHKHFPLEKGLNPLVQRPFHRNAFRLSAFVQSAGIQGRFWEANDLILRHLRVSDAESLDLQRLAILLRLDKPQWNESMISAVVTQRIQEDLREGIRLGVTGTPTYLIAGVRYEGSVPPQILEKVLGPPSQGRADRKPGPGPSLLASTKGGLE